MKTQLNRIAAFVAVMLITMFCATSAYAQAKVADKEIIGVWIMTSMKYEGEDREFISDSYTQVKVYRANGEYACAQIAKDKKGKYYIAPHEYGTYYLKNGMYSEMGREPIKYNWVDKTTSKGRWKNRIDTWKKVVDMPEELTQLIVNKCKYAEPMSDKMQSLMKKHVFKK